MTSLASNATSIYAASSSTEYTFTDSVPKSAANQAIFYLTTTGTAVTSWQIKLQMSHDNDSFFDELASYVAIDGTVTQPVAVRTCPVANGSYAMQVPIASEAWYRLALKRTGGDDTSFMAVTVQFASV